MIWLGENRRLSPRGPRAASIPRSISTSARVDEREGVGALDGILGQGDPEQGVDLDGVVAAHELGRGRLQWPSTTSPSAAGTLASWWRFSPSYEPGARSRRRRPGLVCDTEPVHTTKTALLVALALALAPACKKKEETVEPEEEWMPDESLEPEATPAAAGSDMSEEEKLEQAKGLYVEAEGKAGEGDWAAALPLYEQAYTLVPGKHGFALKVGTAAEQVGDCAKAISYYQHFLKYAEADKYADDIKRAKKAVAKLEKGCEGAE